jgi:uncharacterized protein (DUF2384 family)
MVTVATPAYQSTPDERAGLAVRAATRVFRDGLKAADWLGAPHPALDGRAPLIVATESPDGCVHVCGMLERMADERRSG